MSTVINTTPTQIKATSAQRKAAWVVWTVAILIILGGLALLPFTWSTGHIAEGMPENLLWLNILLDYTTDSTMLVFATIGLLLRLRQPENRLGWPTMMVGLGGGINALTGNYARLAVFVYPNSHWPLFQIAGWIQTWASPLAITIGIIIIPLYFPNGRLPSLRWRPLARFVLFLLAVSILLIAFAPINLRGYLGFSDLPNPFGLSSLQGIPSYEINGYVTGLALLVVIASLVFRFRSSSGNDRLQIKWLVFAFGIFALFTALWQTSQAIEPESALTIALFTIYRLAWTFTPFAVGIALFYYRLYDIDLILNRTLVYGLLTLIITAIYLGSISLLTALFQNWNDLALAMITTGFIAIIFQPLRDRLQSWVNRLFFGARDNPLDLLTTLGEILATADTPSTILPTYCQTIAHALHLPYVSISIQENDVQLRPIAAHGSINHSQPVNLPLSYHGLNLGQLSIALRVGQNNFNKADKRLLEQIAHQTAAAVNAVRLNSDLQKSRERIVTTREEERRRLRRDLHDGLGPVLASQGLKLSAAHQLLNKKPSLAESLLQEVISQNELTVAEIRRLIYDLRPPTLDDLGLIEAIREGCEKFNGDCQFSVHADPTQLPELPAAVEVATYRIALEAATNVFKHAKATRCDIVLNVEPQELWVQINDNGQGISANSEAGIGLISMQERAAELGGIVTIESNGSIGTSIQVTLPIDK